MKIKVWECGNTGWSGGTEETLRGAISFHCFLCVLLLWQKTLWFGTDLVYKSNSPNDRDLGQGKWELTQSHTLYCFPPLSWVISPLPFGCFLGPSLREITSLESLAQTMLPESPDQGSHLLVVLTIPNFFVFLCSHPSYEDT